MIFVLLLEHVVLVESTLKATQATELWYMPVLRRVVHEGKLGGFPLYATVIAKTLERKLALLELVITGLSSSSISGVGRCCYFCPFRLVIDETFVCIVFQHCKTYLQDRITEALISIAIPRSIFHGLH